MENNKDIMAALYTFFFLKRTIISSYNCLQYIQIFNNIDCLDIYTSKLSLESSAYFALKAITKDTLTWLYLVLAKEMSSWSPGVHIFKPIGSIFLSAATIKDVCME